MSRHFVLAFLLPLAAPALADTFRVKIGSAFEGEVLEDRGDSLRIRTVNGVVDIEKAQIVERIPGVPPWKRYEQQRGKYADTAEGNIRLAAWCAKNGLRAEQITHLKRVIELDPNQADARRQLGFVQKDGKWVMPKRAAAAPPTPEELDARCHAREQERQVRNLVAEWFVKIKGIYNDRLAREPDDPPSARFKEGRRLILAIRDPLALPALTGVLSGGSVAVRRIMLESLAQFPHDEATMNILVMTLLDPSSVIRREAAIELIPRKDERIVRELIAALGSDDEGVLRNAATALGILKSRDAVLSLIPYLSVRTRQGVPVSVPVYLDGIQGCFNRVSRYNYDDGFIYYQPTGIGVLGPGTLVGTIGYCEVRTVSVYRTEVQEALIAITGQNFGFDAAAWRQWAVQN